MRTTMSPKPLDPNSTELRPLADYCNRLPSSHPGKRLNRSTLWRWSLKGLSDGRWLRTKALGAGRVTCDKWVCEFLTEPRPEGSPAEGRPALSDAERARLRVQLQGRTDRGAA